MTERTNRPLFALTALLSSVTLLAGFAIKDLCTTHVWSEGYQYKTSCYNDVYALYFFRGLSKGFFPYFDGDGKLENETDADGRPEEHGDLEYPVGTGLFIGGVARVVRDAPTEPGQPADFNASQDGKEFFRLTALLLAAAAFVSLFFVNAIAGDRRRMLFFALAPSLALYAFHNWDLLAVALMCGALWAFHRESDVPAGILLGVGAATKLFPGVIVPALMLARRREGKRGALAIAIAAAGGFVVLNLPVLLANRPAWWVPWHFQSTRFPNFETSWFMIYRHFTGSGASVPPGFWQTGYPEFTGYASGALFAAGLGLLLFFESRRPVVRPYALSFGIVLVFLLTGKVFSPQYALWLLPFFVLVRVPWYAFGAFAISEAAVWFAISAWFIAASGLGGDAGFRFLIVEIAVWVRYAVLAWLLWISRRAPENVLGGELAAGAVPALAT